MKNMIIAVIIIGAVIGFGGVAAKAETCGNAPLSPCQNGNPYIIMQVWGLTGANTPIVSAGGTVTDEGGVSAICPIWSIQPCSDISRTEYYRQSMEGVARGVVSLGRQNEFPEFRYWFDVVR